MTSERPQPGLERPQPWRPWLRWAAGLGAAGVLAVSASAKGPVPVSVATLGPEARAVHRAIHTGGPFASPKDGIVFGNRERLLPFQARGYYREYTVPTPGARDRGARRIVCGGRVPTAPDACWYTADHYVSFTPITP